MDPRYTLPTRRTVATEIKKLDTNQKEELKNQLESAEWVTITTDLWSSRAVVSYMAVTCHFLSATDELTTKALSVQSFHARETNENIKERLLGVLGEYNITEKVLCACSDRGGNVKKAIIEAGIKLIACFAHVLNTCVKDTFKEMGSKEIEEKYKFGYDTLMKKISDLVTLMKRSNLSKAEFDACQKRLHGANEKGKIYALKKDVDTRWEVTHTLL